MSTPADEIAVDIDAIDAEAAEKAKNKANGADNDGITVEKVEADSKTPAKQGITPEEGIEKLQKQLADERKRADDERAGRVAAESRANESAQAEAKARGDVQTTQLDLIKGAIDTVTQANDVLEANYADAAAAGDWKAAAKAQRDMATNAAKLMQLENGKTALEKAPKPVPRAPADPVEQFASQLSAPSAAWVRAHPEFVRDNHKQQQMLAAHQLAIARGLKADSDEYFQSIEKTLDITAAIVKVDPKVDEVIDDPMKDAARPVNGSGRSAAPAAPVSRSGTGGGSRPNVVRLTPAEVEMAGQMGMTVEDYARNKVALKKEGKLS